MALLKNEQRMHWYVMRDLKRPNAKLPAYKQLSDEHLEVFTPMQWRLKLKNGKRIRPSFFQTGCRSPLPGFHAPSPFVWFDL